MRLRRLPASLALCGAALFSLSGCGANSVSAPNVILPANSSARYTTSVTNVHDSGTGSLRAAIAAVNQHPTGASTITFGVSGTIVLASALPAIAAPVTIDATTAPGFGGSTPVVEIDAAGNAGLVFATGSTGSKLLGVSVVDANGNGITLNAGSITLNLDYAGVNLAGAAAPNSGDGISVAASSSGNFIGLNASQASGVVGNVISGNTGSGLSLHGTTGNTVVANRIGTNPGGTSAIPNGANGIWITAGSNGNVIGGTVFVDSATGLTNNPTGTKGTVTPVFVVPPLGNLVSGNRQSGIRIDGASPNNQLNGNFIGTTANGDGPIGNGADGVLIIGSNGNALIGCQLVNNPFVYYNIMAANGGNGLHITDSNNVTVQANFFGVGANNTAIIPNTGDGILVDGSSSGTQIGGVIPLGNVSSGNGKNGVEIADTASGVTSFNTFGGVLAFKGPAPNANDGTLITSTGGGQTIRTNVLSGNLNNGLEIAGNASGVTVDPDMIGTSTNGQSATYQPPSGPAQSFANLHDGVHIGGTAHANIIGGYYVSVIPENTFSNNAGYGVAIVDNAYGNQVFNTFIGTDTLGVYAIPNTLGGIYVGGHATNNTIGGTTTNQQMPLTNLISGNSGPGVTLAAGTSASTVVGNIIGMDRTGLIPLPNSGVPILTDPASTNNTISGNTTH
jgi:hypothetical protein